jgi:hypothetical protein
VIVGPDRIGTSKSRFAQSARKYWDRLPIYLARLRVYARQEGVLQTSLAMAATVIVRLRSGPLAENQFDASYDRTFGVKTSGLIARKHLDLEGVIKTHAADYSATSPYEFKHAMSRLPINPEHYRFVDYGSGKGRVLLLAAEYPFINVRGIEASKSLHRIACSNIATYPADLVACRDVKSICGDAADYIPDPGPLVIFMFNPFDQVILDKVLQTISVRSAGKAEPSYLIYKNPEHHMTVMHSGCFAHMETLLGGDVAIYKTNFDARPKCGCSEGQR